MSPRQLPNSNAFPWVINRFMASGDVSHSKLPGLPRNKIIEENIDTLRNLVEVKPNFSISLQTPASNFLPQLVNIVERYAASLNKDRIVTAVNVFYQEPKLASNLMEGHFLSINWNLSKKCSIVNFILRIFFPQMSNIRQYK